jgi:hypothetical protein
MNSVEIRFGASFTLGDDIIDDNADQKFYEILQKNLSSENFDLKKLDYARHGEGGHLVINDELKITDYDLDINFKKVSDIIDNSIDDYCDDFFSNQSIND